MGTRTPLTPTSLLLSGLLVLAAICADARPAFAQAPLECPLPAGVTPPADLSVTAQQVEDGSASLMDFALAARDLFVSELQGTSTPGVAIYYGCLFRQEGSSWRSGSTYLVRLTPDGRVYIHGKDMALSGRQLTPIIYGAILEAVGISPTALTDPAAVQAAFAAAAAGDGGPFAVPSIAGASGYAIADVIGQPIVTLYGFDLDASHLVAEDIVHIEPAITARDVVDRATLQAFVAEAGAYFTSTVEAGSADALSQAKIAFRDPNGPWRHDPVYLAVMERTSRLIVFHGAFPDRFELRRGGIATDIATGELVVDQLVAAADSSPEGGFWEYYFDNPADDNDSADVPKVGYARVFTVNLPAADGRARSLDVIVNSGFYLPAAGMGDIGGRLENPGLHSFQSGVGALWGWVCEAERVEIEIAPLGGEVQQYVAAHGLERLDTLDTCGDTDNGFVLLFNWNRLGAGVHTVTARADGVALGRTTVQVTTLGAGADEEFLRDVAGECTVADFPYAGETVRLEWQQNQQNFVITDRQDVQ